MHACKKKILKEKIFRRSYARSIHSLYFVSRVSHTFYSLNGKNANNVACIAAVDVNGLFLVVCEEK